MRTTVSSKGQIVLPPEFRQMDRVEPGQEFDVERLDRGDYRLVRRAAPRNEGAIDWLLACPQKGFFAGFSSFPREGSGPLWNAGSTRGSGVSTVCPGTRKRA
jgi:hypothetical protein